MIQTIQNAQKQIVESEKRRLYSSGFCRTDVYDSQSEGSADTEFTEAMFFIAKSHDCGRLGFGEPTFPNSKALVLSMQNSQNVFSADINIQLCLSRFCRTHSSNQRRNDSVDADFTESSFLFRKPTVMPVMIPQSQLFQFEKQWLRRFGIHRNNASIKRSNDGPRLDFANFFFQCEKHEFLWYIINRNKFSITKTTIVLFWILQDLPSIQKSNDSVDKELIDATFLIWKTTLVLVRISQNLDFQFEKRWFCRCKIYKRDSLILKNNDCTRRDFAEPTFPIRWAMIPSIHNSQKHLFHIEKQRMCSSRFRRTNFRNSNSDDSIGKLVQSQTK